MGKTCKALLSLLLSFGISSSFCACSSAKSDEARTLCETFCEDVKSGDAGRLAAYPDSSDVTESDIQELIRPESLNDEEAQFSEFMKNSLSYSVLDPVYDPNAKTATVYISFRKADYSAEEVAAACSFGEFEDALSSAPEAIDTYCVTVDFNGVTPVIKDPMAVVEGVYSYNKADIGIMPGTLSDYCLGASVPYRTGSSLVNCKSISAKVNFKPELMDNRYIPGVIYEIERDGKVLFTSEVNPVKSNRVGASFTTDLAVDDSINEDGFLIAGKYSFVFYDEYMNELVRAEIPVENVVLEDDTIEFTEQKNDYYLSNNVFDAKDSDIVTNFDIAKSGWWDYDGTSVGKSVFASNTKIIGYSLEVKGTYADELYYDYYFSEEADFEGVNEAEPLLQASCKPTFYDGQACYDLDYTASEYAPGYYGLVVYSDPGRKHIVFVASCIVVEETTEEVGEE